jgi:hypothetical protein
VTIFLRELESVLVGKVLVKIKMPGVQETFGFFVFAVLLEDRQPRQ